MFKWFWTILSLGAPVEVQVQVHLFTLIQLQYDNNKKKEEVKTELTIKWIKHNKGKTV